MKNIPILYEDNELAVFEKPPGMLVIPAPGKKRRVLTEIVNAQHGDARWRLHPCHRLDLMTSGAVIYAKGKKNQKFMREVFHQGGVEKTYIAFVKGRLSKRKGVMRSAIKDFHQKKFARQSRAKMAVTKYRVLEYKEHFSVIEANLETGRTNQIRIHFSELGHPVLGERVYAFRKDFIIDMKRLALHGHRLSFKNPVSKKMVNVVSELPDDMELFLKNIN